MGEVCIDKIIDYSTTKTHLHQRTKCQENVWNLKMAKFGVTESQTNCNKLVERQGAEFEEAESQENLYGVCGLGAGEPTTTEDNLELRTIKLTQSVASDFDPQPPTVQQTGTPLKNESRLAESEIDSETVEHNVSPQQENNSQSSGSSLVDHKRLVIWRHPILTLHYFTKELYLHVHNAFLEITHYRRIPFIVLIATVLVVLLHNALGSNHPTLSWARKKFLWCLYWLSLGLLSSVGLGTGVHTFTLYLGPYIASVTVAESEGGYLGFLEEGLECDADPRWASTLWNTMCKVRLESYMWGLGTAVGELPPYFMGRASRMSKQEEKTEVLQEFEELERKVDCPESLTRSDRLKLFVRDLVVKAGFWGVLACASIPNPFFDLVGITCGHFLVPFWTFFGAALIGKAVIKTTIQQVLIILSYNKVILACAVDFLSKIPLVGERLQTHFSQYVVKQKEKYSKEITHESGWFSKAYHVFVFCTTLYCFVSIINSLAQNHHRRLKKQKEK